MKNKNKVDQDDPFRELRDSLLSAYKAKTNGAPHLIRNAMNNGYLDGLNSVFNWMLKTEQRHNLIENAKALEAKQNEIKSET